MPRSLPRNASTRSPNNVALRNGTNIRSHATVLGIEKGPPGHPCKEGVVSRSNTPCHDRTCTAPAGQLPPYPLLPNTIHCPLNSALTLTSHTERLPIRRMPDVASLVPHPFLGSCCIAWIPPLSQPPRIPFKGVASPYLEPFQLETRCVSSHTACRFAGKTWFFRSLWAGRRCAAVSRFPSFNGKTL